MGFFDKIIDLVTSVYFYFRLYALRLLLFVQQKIEYQTSPKGNQSLSRSILLIGDATAEGSGDLFGSAGLTARITKLFKENRDQHKLFLIWKVLTVGRTFSTAKDWVPSDSSSSTSPESMNLFEKRVVKGPFRSADVIVISFGVSEDFSTEQSRNQLVTDVTRIAEATARMGKHAVVCSFPNFNDPKSDGHKQVRQANSRLTQSIEELEARLDSKIYGSVKCAVDVSKVSSMGSHVMRWENSFFSFNNSGYRLLAREVFEGLIPAAKKVEWIYWKSKLTH